MGWPYPCILFGQNIFSYSWVSTGKKVEILDPVYKQKHVLPVYTVNMGDEIKEFAAGEFSNSIYGFYIEE